MLIDANVLLRLFDGPEQPQHDLARQRITAAEEAGEPLRVLGSTVIEVAFVLASTAAGYGLPRTEIALALRTILEDPSLTVEGREVLARAVELYERHPIDLPDCVLAASAEAMGETVFSFDGDFDRLRAGGLGI